MGSLGIVKNFMSTILAYDVTAPREPVRDYRNDDL